MNVREDLTIREAAALAGLTPETLRVWVRGGRVKAHKAINGQWRIPRAEIERALGYESEPQEPEARRA
ncbi:helix-turn-helix domain-containing protein [Gulosibacter sediminis]|uniref:helix-turn-helix domain-containing protein n=1 Tax=Gulosibacter sediminis TaxID=1729695 RepID=UPI003D15EB8A